MSARRAVQPALHRLVTGQAGRGAGVVLGYHDVVAGTEVDLELNVTARMLRRQLMLVRRLGYRFVSLAELLDQASRGCRLDGLAAVTFDDALAGVVHHGLPVLQDLEVPATVFAVSARWGRRPDWFPGSGPTMTRAQLLEASTSGLTIASHTRTHASLPNVVGRSQGRTLRDEVSGSRSELEDLIRKPVDLFAYPFGHHDPTVRESVREAGYRTAFTFLNGRFAGVEDPFRVPRLTMGRHHDSLRFAYHLARPADTWPDHQGDAVTEVPTPLKEFAAGGEVEIIRRRWFPS